MELCKQFGAGRNSVREAVKKLQAYGILYIKRADGTFVSENYNQKMLDPMLYSIILQKNSWQEFVELRSVIDIGTLNIIIQRNDITSFCRTCTAPWRAFCRNALAGAFGGQGAGAGQPVPHPDRQCGPEPYAGHHHRVYHPADDAQPSGDHPQGAGQGEEEIERFVELHRQLLSVIERRQVDEIAATVQDHYIFWKK